MIRDGRSPRERYHGGLAMMDEEDEEEWRTVKGMEARWGWDLRAGEWHENVPGFFQEGEGGNCWRATGGSK